MQASFGKLPSGKWGIKISADLGQATKYAGQSVSVVKRDGSAKEVRLGRLVTAWNADRAAMYEVHQDAKVAVVDERLPQAVAKLTKLESEGRLSGFTQGMLDAYRKDGFLSSKRIDCLMRDESEIRVSKPGVYALDGQVYRVQRAKRSGNLYALRLVEINADRLTDAGEIVQHEFEYDRGAIMRLRDKDRMTLEDAKRLSIRYGCCIACGAKLSAAKSVEQNIGPVCIKKFASTMAVAA